MPTVKRPGKRGFYVELPDELDAAFRAWVDAQPLGTITQHVQWAIRRHMASPPTVDAPPLPPEPVPATASPRRTPRGF